MRALLVTLAACAAVLAAGEVRAQAAFYFHMGTGRYLEAEKAGEERIKSAADRTTRNLAPLCYIYYKLRRYNKLFACVADLEKRIAAGDHMHSDTMISQSDAAPLPNFLKSGAFLELGDPRKAIEEGERGIAGLKDGYDSGIFSANQYRVEGLPTLGIAAGLLGMREQAERYVQMLSRLEIPYIGGQQRRNLKEVGLARMYIATGQYEKALAHLGEEQLGFARAVQDAFAGGGGSFATLYELPKLLMIGKSQLELGRLTPAKDALDKLIGHKLAPEQGDIYWIALYERGRLAEREGKPAEAIEYYRRAIEVIEQQRASLTTEATKIGFVGNKQQVYGRLVALLVSGGRAAEAFDIVERSKARALVDMLAEKKDFTARGPDPEKARRILAELDRADTEARAMTMAATQGPEVGQVRSLRAVQAEMQSAAPELASLVTVSTVALAELRALLGVEEALIEYYYDESSLYAFVVTREGVQVATLERPGLTGLVAQFRRRVEDPATDAWRAPARGLYQRLIAPLEAQVKARDLALVPHGALHYLPFAALTGADDRPLIERYGLRVLPSASVLKFIRPPVPRSNAQLLVFGNPDLGDPKMDLAFAEVEARTLAGMHVESRLLVRKDATETNFKKAAGVFPRIHLATHGKFQAESPLDSGLMLARDAENDGLLRVGELYSMDLDAELVTLSACETGLGKVDNGDDVVGLTRGFLYAGARSIVASLWSVEDRATAELMKAFYEGLQSTGKRDALRQAQLKTRAAFPHPFFWAAFQLIGRPE